MIRPFVSMRKVASGSVSAGNMKLSMVDGKAFVDFSLASVLTDYADGNHLLTITDNAGRKARGYIKAAGSAETYGSAKNVSTLVNNTGFYAFETFDSASATGFHAINTSQVGSGGTPDELSFSFGDLIKTTLDIVVNSGIFGSLSWLYYESFGSGNIGNSLGHSIYNGSNSGYDTIKETTTGVCEIVCGYYDNFDFTLSNLAIKQVLTPSSTGVTIVSAKAGSTYNWTAIDSGFEMNGGIANWTYEITL